MKHHQRWALHICKTVWKTVYIDQKQQWPRIGYCSTPASLLDHEHTWEFSTILYFLNFKMSVRVLKRLPNITFCFYKKIRPLSYALSKSYVQDHGSNFLTVIKYFQIWFANDGSCFMQEFLSWKPNWFCDTKLFSMKTLNILS